MDTFHIVVPKRYIDMMTVLLFFYIIFSLNINIPNMDIPDLKDIPEWFAAITSDNAG